MYRALREELTFHAGDFIVLHGRRRKAHQVQVRFALHAHLHAFPTEDCGVIVVEGVEIGDLNGLVHVARCCLGRVDGWEGDVCVRHIFP